MDPEPWGCGAWGAVGKGYLFSLTITDTTAPHTPNHFNNVPLCPSPALPCCLPVARVTLVRCLKERCSGTKRQLLSKPAKKICPQSWKSGSCRKPGEYREHYLAQSCDPGQKKWPPLWWTVVVCRQDPEAVRPPKHCEADRCVHAAPAHLHSDGAGSRWVELLVFCSVMLLLLS